VTTLITAAKETTIYWHEGGLYEHQQLSLLTLNMYVQCYMTPVGFWLLAAAFP